MVLSSGPKHLLNFTTRAIDIVVVTVSKRSVVFTIAQIDDSNFEVSMTIKLSGTKENLINLLHDCDVVVG